VQKGSHRLPSFQKNPKHPSPFHRLPRKRDGHRSPSGPRWVEGRRVPAAVTDRPVPAPAAGRDAAAWTSGPPRAKAQAEARDALPPRTGSLAPRPPGNRTGHWTGSDDGAFASAPTPPSWRSWRGAHPAMGRPRQRRKAPAPPGRLARDARKGSGPARASTAADGPEARGTGPQRPASRGRRKARGRRSEGQAILLARPLLFWGGHSAAQQGIPRIGKPWPRNPNSLPGGGLS
jgi:hypothetical protein